MKVHILHGQLCAIPVSVADTAADRSVQAYALERSLKAGQSLDHRAPGGDFLVGHHEEAERILDLVEGPDCLHEPAEAELAPEIARRRDDGRDDPRPLR